MSLLLQDRAHTAPLSLCTGNHGNNFRIHVSSGLLMRGPRTLDRERNSSHMLIVEAYNHDLGPMRSSVRVRLGTGWGSSQTTSQQVGKPLIPFSSDLIGGPRQELDWRRPPHWFRCRMTPGDKGTVGGATGAAQLGILYVSFCLEPQFPQMWKGASHTDVCPKG